MDTLECEVFVVIVTGAYAVEWFAYSSFSKIAEDILLGTLADKDTSQNVKYNGGVQMIFCFDLFKI